MIEKPMSLRLGSVSGHTEVSLQLARTPSTCDRFVLFASNSTQASPFVINCSEAPPALKSTTFGPVVGAVRVKVLPWALAPTRSVHLTGSATRRGSLKFGSGLPALVQAPLKQMLPPKLVATRAFPSQNASICV